VLTVPESAVMYDNQKKASVEIPDKKQKEGKRKVSITVGLSNGSVTEVLGGLKEGDQVIQQ
jgi:HlyD family secretion protein